MSGFKRYGVHAREDLHAADELLAEGTYTELEGVDDFDGIDGAWS